MLYLKEYRMLNCGKKDFSDLQSELTEAISFYKTSFIVILRILPVSAAHRAAYPELAKGLKRAFAAARQMPVRRIPVDRTESDGSSGAAISGPVTPIRICASCPAL